MSISITDTVTFPKLSQYAVLAGTGITPGPGIIVRNGYYGSSTVNVSTVNNIYGDGSPFGPRGFGLAGSAPQDAIDAQAELSILINNLLTTTIGALTAPARTDFTANSDNTVTLLPFVQNQLTTTTGLTGVKIVLDAQGYGGSAKFYITCPGTMVLNNIVSIKLVNGANSNNVYWYASDGITFTGTSPTNTAETGAVPGIFIAGNYFTTSDIINIAGRVFAHSQNIAFSISGAIPFNGSGNSGSNVDTTPYSGAAICFPRNTPINTDQGIMPIELIKPGVHTIDGQRIIAVPQSVQDFDDHLICLEKDSLGPDCPTARTLVSRNHAVLYKEKLVRAYDLLDDPELSGEDKVHKVPYSGELLFNILMDSYTTVTINNMVCETLHPDHHIAKLYQVNVSEHVPATASAY